MSVSFLTLHVKKAYVARKEKQITSRWTS